MSDDTRSVSNTWQLRSATNSGLPANGGVNLTHHTKVNVGQLASAELEQVPRVGIAVVVALF